MRHGYYYLVDYISLTVTLSVIALAAVSTSVTFCADLIQLKRKMKSVSYVIRNIDVPLFVRIAEEYPVLLIG